MDWSALGGNPAPGDLAVVRALGQLMTNSARDSYTTEDQLRRLQYATQDMSWVGEAANSMEHRFDNLPPYLRILGDASSAAAAAFQTYLGSLTDLQNAAQRGLVSAQTALTDKGVAETGLSNNEPALTAALTERARLRHTVSELARQQVSLQSAGLEQTPQAQSIAAELASAKGALASAEIRASDAAAVTSKFRKQMADADERLRAAQGLASAIRDGFTAATKKFVAQLNSAGQISIPEDPALLRLGRWIKDVERPTKDLQTFLNVLGGINAVLSWVSYIPVVGAFAAAAEVALDVVVLFGETLQALYGQRSWASVGGQVVTAALDAAAILPVAKELESGSIVSKKMGVLKRALNYDDATKATGSIRKVHVAPKFDAKVLKQYPGISAESLYQVSVAMHFVGFVHHNLDSAAKGYLAGNGVYLDVQHGGWAALPESIGRRGTDMIFGDGTAEHISNAMDAASKGDVHRTITESLHAIPTTDKAMDAANTLSTAAQDAGQGDVVQAVTDLGGTQ